MAKKKKKVKDRSFERPRKWGLTLGIVVGLGMAGVGTYNSMKEMAKWGDDFSRNIDAVYEGKSENRFVVSPPVNPGADPVLYHIKYGIAGAALALGCALVAGATKNKGYNPMPRKDAPHVSYAAKDSDGKWIID